MKKLIKKLIYTFLLLFIILVCFISFLVHTTTGLRTAIKLSQLYLPGSLKAHHVEGTLWSQFSIGQLEYLHGKKNITINKLAIHWHLDSLFNRRILIKDIKANQLMINENSASHKIDNIHLNGVLNQHQLSIDALGFDYLNHNLWGQLQIDAIAPHALSGVLKLNPQNKAQNKLNGLISLGGTIKQLQWSGDLHGAAELSLSGTLQNVSELNQLIKWRNLKWFTTHNELIDSPEGRITLQGTLPNIKMNLSSRFNSATQGLWQINAEMSGRIPWQWDVTVDANPISNTNSKQAGLYTNLHMQGTIQAENKGTFALTIAPGYYSLPNDTLLRTLKFQGGTIKASLSPTQLAGKGELLIDVDKKINTSFSLPHFSLSKGFTDEQPVKGTLSFLFNSFDFLHEISPELLNPKGQLNASVHVDGTLARLQVNSEVKISKGSVTIPHLGLSLDAINCLINGSKEHWQINGSINSQKNTLQLKGNGSLVPMLRGELSMQGNAFPIINTQEYQISASPELKLSITPASLNITGSILIPKAQIKPTSFANSLTLSEDVVLKSAAAKPAPSPINTHVDINLKMGDAVEVAFKGLHALLAGTVNLKQQPQGPLTATGELSVKKGEYKAYGQNLTIQHGELLFTGGPINNPGINLKAEKSIDIDTANTTPSSTTQLIDFNNNNLQSANLRGNITVGVEVTGRLDAPKIQLFSNPPVLSQADTLSMLVLGRPVSQANQAGGQLLLAAISSMNLGSNSSGAQLLEQVKQNLGFDINLKTTSNYNLATNQISDSTGVVVGKSLSKRIYLSYNMGISQTDPNVLTLKYILNKFLSIQVSSSTAGSGIDVLYTKTAATTKNN